MGFQSLGLEFAVSKTIENGMEFIFSSDTLHTYIHTYIIYLVKKVLRNAAVG